MRVSQRLDYALQALVLLARQPRGRLMPAGDVADALHLPRRFVEQQITALAHANIVECRRGATGGCVLARPADRISVSDVVSAIQGEVLDIPRQMGSATAEMWETAARRLEAQLAETSLASLAERQAELDEAAQPMYFI